MATYVHYARFAIVWLVLFLIGRLVLGATGVPYAQGTTVFSMVVFTYFAALFFGAFSRRLWNLKWTQAMVLGATIAICAQILILLATVVSYLVGADTYFNHPTALNVEAAIPLGQALVARLVGLVVNTIASAIIALIGWAMGNLVPQRA